MNSFKSPHAHNIDPFSNRTSIAADEGFLRRESTPGSFIDEMNGHRWNYEIREGDGVYGIAENFPEGPLDHLAAAQYVQVPFRRIPRIPVRSIQEIDSIKDSIGFKNGDNLTMWRGQTKLHLLDDVRTSSDKAKLYGSNSPSEPSLTPSAARENYDINSYMAAWFSLLDHHVNEYIDGTLRNSNRARFQTIKESWINLRSSYNFRAWAYGIAQHYGLPSTGLDLTPDLNVAVFFALHTFTKEPTGESRIDRLPPSANPVVFLMRVFSHDLASDEQLGPPELATPRAKAQKAHFFTSAWGSSPNKASERIVAVFDLIDHANWSLPELTKQLFPSNNDDHYANFFHQVSKEMPDILKIVPLDKIYYTK